ncbi:MAG: glycine zipper 2TM domain-containing protein [Sphingobium sp.]|jgi:hypothetical protein|nr:glycine zipper 2TM domain-containing protein [Sphingobium sp.]MCP5400175.1 glycine zipper 2TM domain-containing protein [Sphingomonas sp.]
MKKLVLAATVAPLMTLAACADNYAVEGAAAGAAGGALLGGEEGAAIGAAAGGVIGSQIKKDGKCDGYDRDGRLDPDCYGRDGYPDR